jgi:PAS domain S-box-containing protein
VSRQKAIWLSILLGVFLWVIDSIINTLIFHKGNFITHLLTPTPHELYMRLTLVGMFIFALNTLFLFREQRRSEKALKESEAKFKVLSEKSLSGIYLIQDGVFKYVNPRVAEIFGYRVDELTEKKGPKDLTLPEDWPTVEENLKRRISGEIESIRYDFRGITKDKEIIYVEVYGSRILYQGRPAVIGTLLDITERKKAEDVLKKSEERYRNLVENTPEVIYSLSSDGTITSLNPAFERITGWTVHEWIGKPFMPLIYPDDLPRAIETFQKILQGERISSYELRVLSKSGEYLTGEFTSTPQIEDGKVVGEFGIVRDITERKKMEEKIFAISQDWEATFNSITDMVTIHDKDYNIIKANKAAEKILGLPLLEIVPGTKCFKYYHGTSGPPLWCPSCDCLKTGIPATFEIFEPHLNMFIEIRAIPRFNSDGNIAGLVHVVRDISKRKEAEEQINKLLQDVTKAKIEWEKTFDNAMELIILVDKECNIIRCNKSFAEFMGVSIHEVLGRKCYEVLPCCSEAIEYCKEKIQAEEQAEWVEVKTERGHWLYVSHRPVFDERGEFLHSVIIATDITALKNAQDTLSKSEEELKKRVEELEKFYEMAVGRELRMKEIKKEIKRLEAELERYVSGKQ